MVRLARPAHRDARRDDGLVHQLIVLVGISVLSGVLIAALALPWVGLADQAAKSSAEAIESFPLELHFKPLNERTQVLDSGGNVLATFYDENRTYVKLDQVSPDMQHAILAIEDARFYQHGPIDIKGTLRAMLVNQASATTVQGGSSITQQLVKLTLLEDATTKAEQAQATAETYARKFQELRYAVWVEQHLTKNQILEHYLNTAYFGDGAYGIQAAAHHYFSTTADKLTLAQSALLAGLVKNPSGYDPVINPQAGLDRRYTVLDKMLSLHIISTAQAQQAEASPLGLRVSTVPNGCLTSAAPFFCSYLENYLLNDPALGKTRVDRRHTLYAGGLTIKSSLDMRFQHAADAAVAAHVHPTDRAIGALAMVQPGTGYVRALAQSRPMGSNAAIGESYINYTVPDQYGGSGGFQAGSTFKVFVLATAIAQGVPLNKTIYSPSFIAPHLDSFSTCGGKPYNRDPALTYPVHNSTTSGDMNLYTGTQQSVNTFFVQLEELTGLCAPWTLANKMGAAVPVSARVPAFTLGVSSVSPLQMAEAYATFADRGVHCDSTPILAILNRDGQPIPTAGPKCSRVMQAPYADAVNDILRGVMGPSGFGAPLALNQPSAGKTGTTDNNNQVWFVGYTPSLTAASMVAGVNSVGHHITLNGQTLAGTLVDVAHGSTTAGPIWGQAMKAIQQWLPNQDFVPPDKKVVAGQPVTIPPFYGVGVAQTAQQLTQLGFKPQVSYSVNSSAPRGTVAYISPSSQGFSGQRIVIHPSTGYVPAPPPPPSPSNPPAPPPPPPPPSPAPPTHPNPTHPNPTHPNPTHRTPSPPTHTHKPRGGGGHPHKP
ncbi:MAG: transglycosylase domain-containing protein [Nocardioidaceae bacterium]